MKFWSHWTGIDYISSNDAFIIWIIARSAEIKTGIKPRGQKLTVIHRLEEILPQRRPYKLLMGHGNGKSVIKKDWWLKRKLGEAKKKWAR